MPTPVVLIHGLFGSLSNSGIMNAFPRPGIFAFDLIGYGANRTASTETLTLEDQADHIAGLMSSKAISPSHIVGHSIGGAVAVLFASKYPELTRSLTSVEGNFTLKDAFWSGEIAKKPLSEVQDIIDGYKADPDTWISKAGVPLNDWTKTVAREWLDNQPASTIRAHARAAVEATSKHDYLKAIRELIARELPYHLIAGERSRSGWDVPVWAEQQCSSYFAIPETGHLMMLEAPTAFAHAVCANLD